MIRYDINENDFISINQSTVSPSIYLDHWALRAISEEKHIGDRFISIIKKNNGTLMISLLNLFEFSNDTDYNHAKEAEILIESLLPNIFFIEIDPFKVIDNENKLLNGASPFPPHSDRDFLKAFSLFKPNGINPFTANELLTTIQRSGLKQHFDCLSNTIIQEILKVRKAINDDISLLNKIKRKSSGPNIQHGTRYIFRELARFLCIDQQIIITKNHAIDLLHSVVPVSYCDYVLLDKHWVAQVEQL